MQDQVVILCEELQLKDFYCEDNLIGLTTRDIFQLPNVNMVVSFSLHFLGSGEFLFFLIIFITQIYKYLRDFMNNRKIFFSSKINLVLPGANVDVAAT